VLVIVFNSGGASGDGSSGGDGSGGGGGGATIPSVRVGPSNTTSQGALPTNFPT
jgi:hypothetical protein